jgi:serine phosphatase RsbU (regulator of sigma subunit)
LLIQHAAQPAQRLADLILEEVNTFTEEQGLFDDATLLVLKRA